MLIQLIEWECFFQASSKNQKGSLRKLTTVPNLVGLQLRDAEILLGEYGIKIGTIVGVIDSANSGNYFIYKQYPSSYKNEDSPNYIHKDQRIDVWIQKEKPIIHTRHVRGANANDYLDPDSTISVKKYQRVEMELLYG